jgi:hypothetical protein
VKIPLLSGLDQFGKERKELGLEVKEKSGSGRKP